MGNWNSTRGIRFWDVFCTILSFKGKKKQGDMGLICLFKIMNLIFNNFFDFIFFFKKGNRRFIIGCNYPGSD